MTDRNADGPEFTGPLDPARAATAVLDKDGRIVGWSRTAEKLFGYPAEEVLGMSAAGLLVATRDDENALLQPSEERPGHSEEVAVRHRDGYEIPVSVTTRRLPATGGAGGVSVLLLAEASSLREWVTRQAVLHALFEQSPIGLTIYDTSIRVSWINAACVREMAGPPESYVGLRPDELVPGGRIISRTDCSSLYELAQRVLLTGTPVTDLQYRGRPHDDPTRDRVWSYSYYRLTGVRGEPLGVCEESYDVTDRYQAEQRLHLLVRAGERLGTTLDLRRTASELADLAVPELAEHLTVDLRQEVLEGRPISSTLTPDGGLRRVETRPAPPEDPNAPRSATASHPTPEGAAAAAPVEYAPTSPQQRCLTYGRTVLDEPADGPRGPHDPGGSRTMAVPMIAQHTTMGVVTLARGPEDPPFSEDEVLLADELVRRAAAAVDHARRYAGEHSAALTLQQNLLPGRLPPVSAVDTAFRYLPADSRVGAGGDWFDVIPLSGSRVGLVVGDVVGHGLAAAATMGRLRTTVRALAQLDFAPDELLSRVDDLVAQSSDEGGTRVLEGGNDSPAGTCLYGVYDPVARTCVLARAGHPPPAVVTPAGRVSSPDLPPGPTLGTGGFPFESAEIDLPEGSLLALFTDGLVEARDLDIDEGLARLASALEQPEAPLEELCDRALRDLPSSRTADDAALLLLRTHAFGGDRVADWEVEPDPAAVSELRHSAVEHLHRWDLDVLSFSTELIISELLTNALRYAGHGIKLRLIRDDPVLICEVSDTGHTSPRVRQAGAEDEGGRGLMLVSQVAQRWGTRYTPEGKVIWAEQPIPPEEAS